MVQELDGEVLAHDVLDAQHTEAALAQRAEHRREADEEAGVERPRAVVDEPLEERPDVGALECQGRHAPPQRLVAPVLVAAGRGARAHHGGVVVLAVGLEPPRQLPRLARGRLVPQELRLPRVVHVLPPAAAVHDDAAAGGHELLLERLLQPILRDAPEGVRHADIRRGGLLVELPLQRLALRLRHDGVRIEELQHRRRDGVLLRNVDP
mmetsp:Transcript_24968/g.78183  ORF Transcript_24968/g.78183 Transcript_24968/m.78183 type:complete len:209 (-) Transcript_24968:339-965(-)